MFDAIRIWASFSFNSGDGPSSDLGSKAEMELFYWLDFLNAIGDAVAEELLLRSGVTEELAFGYAIKR